MTEKYCPFKMAHTLPAPVMAEFDWYCEEEDCAWWEEYTEMCSIKTLAFLRGIGAERLDILPTCSSKSSEPITTIDVKEGNDD